MNSNLKNPGKECFAIRLRLLALCILIPLFSSYSAAATGTWTSQVTGSEINYKTTDSGNQELDASGNKMTVVYLENLGFDKIGKNTNEDDVAWLLSQGYRVIELDYANDENAVSPTINEDIIAINDAINSGSFCGLTDCSTNRSYILFEGYRIARDVSYFKNDPTVYNWPSSTAPTDSLYMDIIYPSNADERIPVILSFSYSNSYGGTYQHRRLFLGYTLAMFDDSFLEGAPAKGIAWAIADHPKFADWGQGKPAGGDNKTYASYEVNPDAAQKVKSAIRTLRVAGDTLGLSGKIGIYGFSRGSDAGSMAIGDKTVEEFENAGINIGVSDDVQAAALGSGVFDFTQIYNTAEDDINNLRDKCPLAWGPLADNYSLWETMGSAYLVETSATAPVIFFYNTDDANYYQDQIKHLKEKLESLDVPVSTITDYGTGHAVPKDSASLATLYAFFNQYLETEITDTIYIEVYDTIKVIVYDTIFVSVDDTLIINLTSGPDGLSLSDAIEFKLYPNPTTKELNVDISDISVIESLEIDMYTMSGVLIETKPVDATKVIFDISEYSKGIYLFKVRKNDFILEVKKIIIQ